MLESPFFLGIMSRTFNSYLRENEISPKDVSLLRHQDSRLANGYTTFGIWRDNRSGFELYQSHQSKKRPVFNAPYWASFVKTPDKKTLFVGLYKAAYLKVLDKNTPIPDGTIIRAGDSHVYTLELDKKLSDLQERLLIDWGTGGRAWAQHASKVEKSVVHLPDNFKEPASLRVQNG